jgi:ABC-2 type transport system ATP-binding protein
MNDIAIKTNQLTRTYRKSGGGTFCAVDALDLEVYKGEVFAFLGVNGAGKTTTMKMLLGLTFPTSGSFSVLDGNIASRAIRGKIGYLPEESGIYPFLRVEDVLKFYARLFGNTHEWRTSRLESVLEFTGLNDKRHEPVRNLSKGLRQRVGIAQAMINDPQIIFLDEPASGLDPVGIRDLRGMMADLKAAGKTVFLNSHQLSEVELVADRIGMLREGKLLRVGKLSDLLSGEGCVVIRMSNISDINAKKLIGTKLSLPEDTWEVTGSSKEAVIEIENDQYTDDIISLLMANGAKMISVNKVTKNLEDLFTEVMQ